MAKALALAYWQQLLFAFRLLRAIPVRKPHYLIVRLVAFPILWVASLTLLFVNTLGFIADEILFSSYRSISITKPLFVLGVPRSGTTWLQRVLANDTSLTTLSLAEAVFMPSISQRMCFRLFGRLLAPLSGLFRKIPFNPLKTMDAIHKIRLDEPEEDFLLFIPLHACFLFALICPHSKRYWDMSRFDEALTEREQKTILHFYRRCLQKHLYVHGRELTILSKNPSFTPLVASLLSCFPDARIVACVRNPQEVVPSQLNSVAPLQKLIGVGMQTASFNTEMLNLLTHYYRCIDAHSDSLELLDMADLNAELEQSVRKLYKRFDMLLGKHFGKQLNLLDKKGKQYQSQHRYDLESFNLNEDQIDSKFRGLWPLPCIQT